MRNFYRLILLYFVFHRVRCDWGKTINNITGSVFLAQTQLLDLSSFFVGYSRTCKYQQLSPPGADARPTPSPRTVRTHLRPEACWWPGLPRPSFPGPGRISVCRFPPEPLPVPPPARSAHVSIQVPAGRAVALQPRQLWITKLMRKALEIHAEAWVGGETKAGPGLRREVRTGSATLGGLGGEKWRWGERRA